MSPLIIPLITGITELIKSSKHRKENIKTKTTGAAAAVAVATGALLSQDQSLESLITSAVMAIVSLVLFVYKHPDQSK